MNILITGGTGFIGQELLKLLSTEKITLVTRDITSAKNKVQHADLGNIRYLQDLKKLKDLNEFDAVINLAGEPIADKRWSKTQKQKICHSRWDITEQLVSLIHASTTPPHTFISGSAVGYYGDQQQHPFDESLKATTEDFSHKVCAKWEEIALRARSNDTRVCLLRTGVVLGSGGALPKMVFPHKFGVGGPVGSGEQYIPWIHILDAVKAIFFLLTTPHANGAFNITAPHPVSNKQLNQSIAATLGKPHWMFVPQFMMEMMMGESAQLLIDSIRAKPKKLTELGFKFSYSRIEPALKDLLRH